MILGLAILSISSLLYFNGSLFQKTPDSNYEIRWSMAHEPADYFQKTAAKFGEIVSKKTNGKVTVKVVTVGENANSAERRSYRRSLLNSVESGEVDMVQVYTESLAGHTDPSLHVLDAPFLFEDHRHVDRVVEGKIGQDLIKLAQNDKIQSMAFTYSGGFMVLPSHEKEIHKLEDFNGVRMTTMNHTQKEIFTKAFGIKIVPRSKEFSVNKNFREKKTEITHGTYADLHGFVAYDNVKVVNDTRHHVLFTSLVINKKFLNSIPTNYHPHIFQAAKEAARYERRLIEADEELTIKMLEKNSKVKVVRMNKEEMERFKSISRAHYHVLPPEAQEFVKRIKNSGVDNKISLNN